VHVLELAHGFAEEGTAEHVVGTDDLLVRSSLRSALAPAGPILDSKAKKAYRERLDELREDADEAERASDPERAARARIEMAFLGDELAGALGLGGRDRSAASAAERARVNVTRTIRMAIDRISINNPALGKHLSRRVRTGTFCSYAPHPGESEGWQLAL
jgi:non-specific serine/threonine protein kinase